MFINMNIFEKRNFEVLYSFESLDFRCKNVTLTLSKEYSLFHSIRNILIRARFRILHKLNDMIWDKQYKL